MPESAQPVRIAPLRNRTTMRLKAWLPEYSSGSKPVAIRGRELPSQVGDVLWDGTMRVLCLNPGEWLIASYEHAPARLREHCEADLSTYSLVLVDLSEGLLGMEVSGPAARELLARGCALDLHPRLFGANRCARTRFAQIPTTIECFGEPERFELFVVRSHLNYLRLWLEDLASGFTAASA